MHRLRSHVPGLSAAAALAIVSMLCSTAAAARTKPKPPPQTAHALDRHLPSEPLLAFAVALDGAPTGLDEITAELGRLLDEPRRAALGAWIDRVEAALGLDLERQLLPALGPHLALSIDFPPIDGIFAVAQLPGDAGIAPIFARCGVVAAIRDRALLDTMLAELAARGGGATDVGDGVRRIVLSLSGATEPAGGGTALYVAIHDSTLALGLDPVWVRDAARPTATSKTLAAGEDFQRVFSNLDAEPGSWSYVNLPRLREWVAGSQIVALLAASDASVASVVAPLLDETGVSVGVGWTTVSRDGGARTSRFGPTWTSRLALSGGVLAAMVLTEGGTPDERAAIRQTLDTIREIAGACEAFSDDIDGYPGPTDGWVPVERIAVFLEPVYLSAVPRTDAWGNAILYWSDGASYRLISLGRDGQMDQEWSEIVEARPGDSPDSDILFADGRFVVLPPQIVSE